MNASQSSKDSKTFKLAEEAAEHLDELAEGDEAARRSFVSWVTTSPRHLEEAFRMIELNATLSRMWDRKRKRRSKTVRMDAPKTDWVRTIRKYPNRRLYDMVESRYITLSDVRRLVLERVDFVIIEKKSQEDITRSILLQVIAEQDQGPEPIMSCDFLSQIIRSYGGAQQAVVGVFLEQSLKLFAGQQHNAVGSSSHDGGPESSTPINTLARKNYVRWKQVQDEIYRTLINAGANIQRTDRAEIDDSLRLTLQLDSRHD
jgi:polyhydroxyalkanoate synthesis repressor PhaR